MKKPSDIGKLENKLHTLNQKLRDVESRTERIGAATVKLANAIQLLARSSSDNRDLKQSTLALAVKRAHDASASHPDTDSIASSALRTRKHPEPPRSTLRGRFVHPATTIQKIKIHRIGAARQN